ncbi:MAG: ATP-binding protein [Candidatus Marinimicrobia bacterium]|nr:ATP-binding protein [Candidatus Neomarinimicrobiota bacterium]
MIKRTLSKYLLQSAKSMPVIAITGPRQSGKTTLIKNTFPDYPYVTLEDLEVREFAKSDPKGFLMQHTEGLIIDEIQYVPELFSYIQVIVDEKKKNGLFILTGSHNFSLLAGVTQSLAGRVSLYELLPFSNQELLNSPYKIDQYEGYIFNGLYPRIYDKDLSPTTWLSSYIKTYIERDVRQILNVGNLSTFQQFIKICAGRTGQIINLSSIGNEIGISYQTVKKWLSILEATYIIFLLPPYYNNFNKRIRKSPKLYFYDPGLASFLLGIRTQDQINTHYLKGELFETFILSEIKKQIFHSGKDIPLYFWRDNNENEVDCIYENGNKLVGIEIKSGRTIQNSFFAGLNYLKKMTNTSSDNLFLYYGGDEVQTRSYGNIVSWRHITISL